MTLNLDYVAGRDDRPTFSVACRKWFDARPFQDGVGVLGPGERFAAFVPAVDEAAVELPMSYPVATKDHSLGKVDTMATISLQSLNYQDRFVRHKNFLGELTPIVSDLDRRDASFVMVPGLADRNLISFESVNFPGHFLRHQGFRVKLHKAPAGPGLIPPGGSPPQESPEDKLMREDSTFVMGPGLKDPTLASFRPFNFHDRFLRHRNFELFIEPVESDLDRQDATFRVVEGFVPEAPGPTVK